MRMRIMEAVCSISNNNITTPFFVRFPKDQIDFATVGTKIGNQKHHALFLQKVLRRALPQFTVPKVFRHFLTHEVAFDFGEDAHS